MNLRTGIGMTVNKNLFSENGISRNKYYAWYTLFFIILFTLTYGIFIYYGRSLIRSGDAQNQYYLSLIYIGRYLRSIVKNPLYILQNGLPTFSFNMGYGSDIITTLHYYGIGDPLNLLLVFVPTRFVWIFDSIMIVIRLYLSGIAFSCFCFYKSDQVIRKEHRGGLPKIGILAGALVYAFCGYTFFASGRDPYFINPMIYFPLILTGIEKILDGKKTYLFIIMVFLSACSSFYFFYMIVILTILYVLWRLVTIYSMKSIRSALISLGRIALSAVIGVCMSAVIFFPVLYAVVNSSRFTTSAAFKFFYTIGTYEGELGYFLTAQTGNDWGYKGYAAVSLIAIFLLFFQKEHRDVKTAFIVLTAMTLLPIFGYVLNGLSYTTNRWIWGYSFFVAYIVVLKWNSIFEMSSKDKLRVTVSLSVYLLLCFILEKSRSLSVFFGLAMAFLSVAVILTIKEHFNRRYAEVALVVCIAMNIWGVSYFRFSSSGAGYAEDFIALSKFFGGKTGYENTEEAAITAVDKDDNEFFRYTGTQTVKNSNVYTGLHNTQCYWSLINSNIIQYRTELALSEQTHGFNFTTIDCRTFISTLSNVKYYVQNKAPYGFSYIDNIYGYKVYENDLYLPFGYTYDSYIPLSDYDTMTPIKKQEAMLQGVVIDDEQANGNKADLTFTGFSVPYTLSCGNGLVVEDNIIKVSSKNAKLTLNFVGNDNSETYFYITGLNYTGYSPRDLYSDEEWEDLTIIEKRSVLKSEKYWVESNTLNISLESADTDGNSASTSFYYYTPNYKWYSSRKDFMVNFGYNEKARTTITVTFPSVGDYSFDSIEVLCQPMDNYEEQVSALAEDIMENVEFHGISEFAENLVTGSITLDEPKYLLLTIPYSEGWTAYVDGEEQEVLQANTMFMALYLDEGIHEISLIYHTPLLRLGVTVSCAAFLVLIILIVIDKRKKKI